MGKKPKKNVESCVEFSADSAEVKKKKKKPVYKAGKYPFTIQHVKTKALYVRKGIIVTKAFVDETTGERSFRKVQRQIWRVVDPQTEERAAEVLQDVLDEVSIARTGNVRPLTYFADIVKRYAETQLIEAVYSLTGQKIAGRRSLAGTKSMLDTVLFYFGHREIDSISWGDISDFKIARIKTPVKFKFAPPRPRSIRSVNYELSFLRAIFNFAMRRRWLLRSPFLDGPGLIDKSAETKRSKTWTRAEETKALALCVGGKLIHMKAVIVCCVDGGFRRSELTNSKWAEVNFETGEMIARSYKGKSLHKRSIYLTNRMRAVLIEWKIAQKKLKAIADKSLVIGYKDFKNSWETIRTKIGRPDLNLHDLRHVFGTRLNDKKISLKEIQELLGHSDIKTTQIYINPTTQNLRDSIKVLDED